MTRVYVPATLPRLAQYVAQGFVPGGNEYFDAADESEDAEYEAFEAAADDAVEVLAHDLAAGGRGRRVVITVDGVGAPDGDGIADVPIAKVLAVHADTHDIDPAAGDALPDLAWYATQEIEALLATL